MIVVKEMVTGKVGKDGIMTFILFAYKTQFNSNILF